MDKALLSQMWATTCKCMQTCTACNPFCAMEAAAGHAGGVSHSIEGPSLKASSYAKKGAFSHGSLGRIQQELEAVAKSRRACKAACTHRPTQGSHI